MQYPTLHGQAVALDIETRDPDLLTRGPGVRRGAYIVGVAIATSAGSAYYPVAHESGENLDANVVFDWLRREVPGAKSIVGANLLYDLDFLAAVGIHPPSTIYDVLLAEPLLDENQRRYNLSSLAERHLGLTKEVDELHAWLAQNLAIKPNRAAENIWRAPGHVVAGYAQADVELPLRIFDKQRKALVEQGLWDLFELECSLIPMLLAMRQRGVRVDVAEATRLMEVFGDRQSDIMYDVFSETGTLPQPWAASSLKKIFDARGLSYPLTPKTQAPSFTRSWLEKHTDPMAKAIVDIRRLDKLMSTFLQGFILNGHTNGRIHCQFHPLKGDVNGTVTGRFSSSTPNQQQIPSRTDDGKMLRALFLPDDGQLFGKLDYSQIEYRLMAHDAAELNLRGSAEVVAAYQQGDADFHKIIADMTGLDRTSAKTINFGIAYGEGVKKLCASLGLTERAGHALLDTYHRRAPFMKPLMRHYSALASEEGQVRTIFNRARRFSQWERTDLDGERHLTDHRVPGSSRAFTYKALNARIQGSAADVLKIAMRDIWRSGVCSTLGAPHMIVHDEIDFSVPDSTTGREAFDEVRRIMETCVPLRVPMKVEGGLGANWGDIK